MTELSWRAYFRVAYQLFMDAKVPKKDAIDNILEVVKKHNIPLPEGKTTDKKTDKKRLLNAINNFKANCKNYITTDTALKYIMKLIPQCLLEEWLTSGQNSKQRKSF